MSFGVSNSGLVNAWCRFDPGLGDFQSGRKRKSPKNNHVHDHTVDPNPSHRNLNPAWLDFGQEPQPHVPHWATDRNRDISRNRNLVNDFNCRTFQLQRVIWMVTNNRMTENELLEEDRRDHNWTPRNHYKYTHTPPEDPSNHFRDRRPIDPIFKSSPVTEHRSIEPIPRKSTEVIFIGSVKTIGSRKTEKEITNLKLKGLNSILTEWRIVVLQTTEVISHHFFETPG